MISQFFVLSQRGDHIVFRDCKIWILFPVRSMLILSPESVAILC
jgi:hypothetical protein